MDVSKDEQLLAVLEDSYTEVKIFHHGNSQPHAIYQADGQSFKPLDVCFYTIGGQECLVIADWLNDVLHVLDVDGKLIGHLGADSPHMTKPSALCPDPYTGKRLWVGCQEVSFAHLLHATPRCKVKNDNTVAIKC
jgi:hypothetical protein